MTVSLVVNCPSSNILHSCSNWESNKDINLAIAALAIVNFRQGRRCEQFSNQIKLADPTSDARRDFGTKSKGFTSRGFSCLGINNSISVEIIIYFSVNSFSGSVHSRKLIKAKPRNRSQSK